MRKILYILLPLIILFANSTTIFATNDISVTLNGEKISFDAEPFIENDRVLVPIRKIAEAMDFNVKWEQSAQKATIENGVTILEIFVGNNIVMIHDNADSNGLSKPRYVEIDVPAKVYENRTYIPLRAVGEFLGADVQWLPDRTVVITYKKTDDISCYNQTMPQENFTVNENSYEFILNEQKIIFDSKSLTINGVTTVPIDEFAEKIGFKTAWDNFENKVIVENEATKVEIYINNDTIKIYNKAVTNNYAPLLPDVTTAAMSVYVYKNKVYAPLKVLSDCFNVSVDFIPASTILLRYTKPDIVFYDTSEVITFIDAGVETLVREEIGRIRGTDYYNGALIKSLLEQVKELKSNIAISIDTLEDIRKLPNIETIILQNQTDNDMDISALAFKKNWKVIDFEDTSVRDVSVFNKIKVEEYVAFPEYAEFEEISYTKLRFRLISNKNGAADCTYTQALAKYQAIPNRIEEALECVNENMSDVEKYKVLHDYVASNIEYDYEKYELGKYSYGTGNAELDAIIDEELESAGYYLPYNTLYEVVVEGRGTCGDYSGFYKYLCEEAGLYCEIVSGEAGGTGNWDDHAWNKVKIDGEYYYVDVTWDDTGDGRYEYFILTDEELRDKGTHRY